MTIGPEGSVGSVGWLPIIITGGLISAITPCIWVTCPYVLTGRATLYMKSLPINTVAEVTPPIDFNGISINVSEDIETTEKLLPTAEPPEELL